MNKSLRTANETGMSHGDGMGGRTQNATYQTNKSLLEQPGTVKDKFAHLYVALLLDLGYV